MNVEIPIIILIENSTEFEFYRSKCMLPYCKKYMESYGLIENVHFLYNDEASKELLIENEIREDRMEYMSVNDMKMTEKTGAYYLTEWLKDKDYDWFMTYKIYEPIKNVHLLYEGIRHIEDKYDIIAFSSYVDFNEGLEIVDEKIDLDKISKGRKTIKIIDHTAYFCKRSFYDKCVRESKYDYSKMMKLLWSGKYYIIDGINEISMMFHTKEQIDNFNHFMLKNKN